jgi:uncharacterized membrane protein
MHSNQAVSETQRGRSVWGVTVLLARVVLGERLRWVPRAGLGLAAIGILLVAA